MAKILVTHQIPEVGIKMLRAAGHKVTVWKKESVIPRKELLRLGKGMDAILSMLTDKIDDAVLGAAGPQLKVVANLAVGFDNFDLDALKRHNVIPTNTPVRGDAVAEHAFTLLMCLARRVPEAERFLRSGRYQGWCPMLLLGHEIIGKTLGILGSGQIGAGVLRRGVAMGMKVMYYDIRRNEELEQKYGATYAEIDDVLKTADFVSVHVPLMPATHHLIDAKRLKLMKKTAFLINTARGPIVDEDSLYKALKAKRIAGAGLDVYEHEPKVHAGLKSLENVVLTPHTASATWETRNAMAEMAAKGILAALAGQTPENIVGKK